MSPSLAGARLCVSICITKGRGASGEPAVQPPAVERAGRPGGPGMLSIHGTHDVVVAPCIGAVPPTAFDAFGPGEHEGRFGMHGHGTGQQPEGATTAWQRYDGIGRAITPGTFGAMIGDQCDLA